MAFMEAAGPSEVPKESGAQLGKSDRDIDAGIASFADTTRSHDAVSFTAQEQRVLELYDQLKEAELEKAIVQAQIDHANDPLPSIQDEAAEAQLKQAQRELLEARAGYMLRESVIDGVVQADPVLKAVHAGPNASQSERALHPLIDKRDLLSISQTNLASSLQTTLNAITMVQADNVKAMRKNRELTATLWELASELKTQDLESINDIELRNSLESIQAECRESRKRFRILKGLASGVVAGSGVDWSRDETLRDIVLDDED